MRGTPSQRQQCRNALLRELPPVHAPCAAVTAPCPLSPRRRDHRRVLRARPRGRQLGGAPGAAATACCFLAGRAALVAPRREHGRDDLRDRHAQPRHRPRPRRRSASRAWHDGRSWRRSGAHRLRRIHAALAPDRRGREDIEFYEKLDELKSKIARRRSSTPSARSISGSCSTSASWRGQPRGHQARWRAARLGRLGDPHGGGRRDPGLRHPHRGGLASRFRTDFVQFILAMAGS